MIRLSRPFRETFRHEFECTEIPGAAAAAAAAASAEDDDDVDDDRSSHPTHATCDANLDAALSSLVAKREGVGWNDCVCVCVCFMLSSMQQHVRTINTHTNKHARTHTTY